MKCACDCGREAKPGSKYHHPATCRPRAFKLRQQREGMTRVELKRARDRDRKRALRKQGRIASDDRVSFARAVSVVAEWMLASGRVDPGVAEAEAREVLTRARSQRG